MHEIFDILAWECVEDMKNKYQCKPRGSWIRQVYKRYSFRRIIWRQSKTLAEKRDENKLGRGSLYHALCENVI